jgi:hypothetical protein
MTDPYVAGSCSNRLNIPPGWAHTGGSSAADNDSQQLAACRGSEDETEGPQGTEISRPECRRIRRHRRRSGGRLFRGDDLCPRVGEGALPGPAGGAEPDHDRDGDANARYGYGDGGPADGHPEAPDRDPCTADRHAGPADGHPRAPDGHPDPAHGHAGPAHGYCYPTDVNTGATHFYPDSDGHPDPADVYARATHRHARAADREPRAPDGYAGPADIYPDPDRHAEAPDGHADPNFHAGAADLDADSDGHPEAADSDASAAHIYPGADGYAAAAGHAGPADADPDPDGRWIDAPLMLRCPLVVSTVGVVQVGHTRPPSRR